MVRGSGSCPASLTAAAKSPSRRAGLGRKNVLSTQTQTLDQSTVAVDVNALEVIKQTTTVTDHEQQTTTRVVIVLVLLEVLGQVGDALGEQRDLNLRGAGVALMGSVLSDDVLLFFSATASSFIALRGAAGIMPERSLSAGENTPKRQCIHSPRLPTM